MIIVFFLVILLNRLDFIIGHGRLVVPPARSSAWREDKTRFPVYYDDNQMYCGGTSALHKNEGKCGICGENLNGPRQFEKGGALYTGISVRNYTKGQVIDVKVYLSANHMGWTEFRICNVDNMATDATQECLDKIVLKDLNGNSRIPIIKEIRDFETRLKLPDNLVCKHCVFQWKYHAGNSWNKDPKTGQTCLGCGPQEEFYGCADVTILHGSSGILAFGDELEDATVLTESVEYETTTQSIINIQKQRRTKQKPRPKPKPKPTTPPMIDYEDYNDNYPVTEYNEPSNKYRFSKKVVYNPIANRIEIVLYKNNSKEHTKKVELVPNLNIITHKPVTQRTHRTTTTTTTTLATTTTIIYTTTTTPIPTPPPKSKKQQKVSKPAKAVTKVNNDELCFNGDGHYADVMTDCKEYYVCVFSGTPVVKLIRLKCPGDLYFEPRLKICHERDSVICDSAQ